MTSAARALACPVSLLLVLLAHPLHAQTMTSEERIRSLRAASNAAFEAGDVDGFMATIDADYVGTAGNGGHIRSHEALRELVEEIVGGEDRTYFVRTPDSVEVATAGGRAMETGRWIGYTRIAGAPRATDSGRYTAYWRRVGGRWVIHAEVFVTLPGGGGAAQPDMGA